MKSVLAAAMIVAASFAGVGSAEARTATLQCTSGTQRCNNWVNFSLPRGDGVALVYLQAGSKHCSDVRYTIYTEDGMALGHTGWLSAGEEDQIELDYMPSRQRLVIGATGRKGGCNTGTLGSFSVTYDIE